MCVCLTQGVRYTQRELVVKSRQLSLTPMMSGGRYREGPGEWGYTCVCVCVYICPLSERVVGGGTSSPAYLMLEFLLQPP